MLEISDSHGKGEGAERVKQADERGEQEKPDGKFLFVYTVQEHARRGGQKNRAAEVAEPRRIFAFFAELKKFCTISANLFFGGIKSS